jgi:hypothetical protein
VRERYRREKEREEAARHIAASAFSFTALAIAAPGSCVKACQSIRFRLRSSRKDCSCSKARCLAPRSAEAAPHSSAGIGGGCPFPAPIQRTGAAASMTRAEPRLSRGPLTFCASCAPTAAPGTEVSISVSAKGTLVKPCRSPPAERIQVPNTVRAKTK